MNLGVATGPFQPAGIEFILLDFDRMLTEDITTTSLSRRASFILRNFARYAPLAFTYL